MQDLARDDFSCELQFSQTKMELLKKRHKSHSLLVQFICKKKF